MEYIQYTVTADERWDNIAFKMYGEAGSINGIIQANPDIPIEAIVPAGSILRIPVIEDGTLQITKTEDLPPWMR